jgi:hypothetical protein
MLGQPADRSSRCELRIVRVRYDYQKRVVLKFFFERRHATQTPIVRTGFRRISRKATLCAALHQP